MQATTATSSSAPPLPVPTMSVVVQTTDMGRDNRGKKGLVGATQLESSWVRQRTTLHVLSHSLSLSLSHYNYRRPISTLLKSRIESTISVSHCAEKMPISPNSHTEDRKCSLSELSPLEAILFDIDGTLCDSDPIHYYVFREMLQEIGFNDGVPITEEFYAERISGMHNEELGGVLFPNWDHEKAMRFLDDKEAMYRRLAPQQLKAVNGIHKLCKWIDDRGLKRAAVTNASRANAELMISILGLSDFFQFLVVGSECERAKPSPDPYLKALKDLEASPDHTFVFEDSVSGIKAGVAAGMPVVGLAMRNPEKLLTDAGATLLIKDFEDPKLWEVLEGLDRASASEMDGKVET